MTLAYITQPLGGIMTDNDIYLYKAGSTYNGSTQMSLCVGLKVYTMRRSARGSMASTLISSFISLPPPCLLYCCANPIACMPTYSQSTAVS